MRRLFCQFLLFTAFICVVIWVLNSQTDFSVIVKVMLIFAGVMVLAFLPHIRLRVGRWLRPLLIAVGVALAFLLLIAIVQNEELRLAMQALIEVMIAALLEIINTGTQLLLVIAVLALIIFGVMCARRPTSSA